MNRMDDNLAKLWVEYRQAVPDPEPSADFMPKLWRRIDARRQEPLSVFRRLAQVCVMTTLALALLMSVIIPELQQQPGLVGTYVDALAEEQSRNYAAMLAADDVL
jgi:hypothetical protein